MANFRFQLNHSDMRKILQKEGLDAVEKIGENILDSVGEEHYEIQTWVGKNRGRVTVIAKPESAGHEAKHHNLIRALGQTNV